MNSCFRTQYSPIQQTAYTAAWLRIGDSPYTIHVDIYHTDSEFTNIFLKMRL